MACESDVGQHLESRAARLPPGAASHEGTLGSQQLVTSVKTTNTPRNTILLAERSLHCHHILQTHTITMVPLSLSQKFETRPN